MKVILMMSISLNAMAARENGEEDWLPTEGWEEFLVMAKRCNNIVMGRETYDNVTKLYTSYNFDNVECAHKIVISRDTGYFLREPYVVVHSPREAVRKMQDESLEHMLLIGGGKLNSAFLKEGLVDEVWVTVNPFILGKGRPFVAPEDIDTPLDLLETQPLTNGRILLKYTVIKG